jgi:glycosyltransferase involved in cell wall biosynthesis
VHAQTRAADTIVVIADICADRTAEIAASKGVDVFETLGNVARKAGALNQAYARVAPGFEYILEMDADTTLHPRFLEEALAEIEANPLLGGVCNRFFAKPAPGLLRRLQALEYVRYERLCDRLRGRVSVLSGTATLLRTAALPGRPWSEDSLVEDYALTLYLRRNGFEVKAGADHRRACRDGMAPRMERAADRGVVRTRGALRPPPRGLDSAVNVAFPARSRRALVGKGTRMYGHAHVTSGVAGATAVGGTAAGGTLPLTGLSLVWWLLLAATLILVGATLLRMGHAVGRIRRGDRPDCLPAGNREPR